MTADDLGRWTPAPAGRTRLAGVVLAAGLGTRLRPLTDLRPKALCPVGGVPLVDLALARLAPHVGRVPDNPAEPQRGSDPDPGPVRGNPRDVGRLRESDHLAVNAHHHADQLLAHLDGRVHVSMELPMPLGTAGALGRLRGWLDGRDALLTNADAYLPTGLAHLVTGWDGERCRLLVRALPTGARGDFLLRGTAVRYVGACLIPWRLVAMLGDEPSGLYEVLWRGEHAAGRLDLVATDDTAIDCGTPPDYLAANLHASGGLPVVGSGAVVEGTLERCVVWDGAYVGPHEHLAEVVRAGSRESPVTVDCR